MFKNITIFSLFVCLASTAQVAPTLINSLTDGNQYEGLADVAYFNNKVYISNPDAGKIFSVDVSVSNAPVVEVLDNVPLVTGITVVGNELYFLQAATPDFAFNSGTLSKINLNDADPAVVPLFGNLSFPMEIEVSGANVYVVEAYITMFGDLDHSEVSVVNLSGTPAKTVLHDDFYSLDDIDLYGTDLYLLEWNNVADQTTIQKMDVSSGTPVTPTLYYADTQGYFPYKMEIANDKLYFNMDNGVNSSVMSIDLTQATPAATAAVGPFQYNDQSVYVGELVVSPANMMYAFASSFDGVTDDYLLYQANLTTLVLDGVGTVSVTAVPNPCQDVLTLTGLDHQAAFEIYDISGKQVMAGNVSLSGTIDLTAVSSGIYLVKSDSFRTFKIVKQ